MKCFCEYDIAVLGGGSGGLVVASAAAQLGAGVLLVEKNKLGGDCLFHGCVPSKTFIESSRVVWQMKNADLFGIKKQNVEFDYTDIISRVQEVIKDIAKHDTPERFESLGCEVVFGSPKFVSDHKIEVGGKIFPVKKVVIAVGGRPAIAPIPGLEEVGFLTNLNFFENTKFPENLIVFGAGPIGIELAQAMNRLGSKVDVLDKADSILTKEDEEVRNYMEGLLAKEGLNFHLGVDIKEVQRTAKGKKVIFRKEGKVLTLEGDEIFVGLGRAPNVEDMELERAGIKYSRKGIIVDGYQKTSAPNIYACGDCTEGLQFTHAASYQAGIIIQNVLFPFKAKANYDAFPWVTYTEPEVARIGLTEEDAKSKFGNIKVYHFNVGDNDRFKAMGSKGGFIKVVTDIKGYILGAHIVSAHAGEFLPQLVIAMKKKMKFAELANFVVSYPTAVEVIKQAALIARKEALKPWVKKVIKKVAGLKGN
ncbi:MAG: NAD(P)/FAD-dependent oxidoreductase [bacterium]